VTPALLDVNVLTALLWPAHEHHEAAHRWFGARRGGRWATCALTQLGLVRIVSDPAFSRDALPPGLAVALLAQNLAHPGHEFWPENVQVPAAVALLQAQLQGYRQLTDAYLLALAARRKGALATFDRGVRSLAGDALRDVVEIVPIR
jgi:toxin-antitoxin system PIN domain toxin